MRYIPAPNKIIKTFFRKSMTPLLVFLASLTLPNSESYDGGGARKKKGI